MEKRVILAIVLSLLVLLSWSLLATKFYPIENKSLIAKYPASLPAVTPRIPTPTLEPEVLPSSLMKLSQKKYELTFIESQAAIKEVIFPSYLSYKFPLKYGFLLGGKNLVFKKEIISDNSATFVYSDKDKQIIKQFSVSKSNYSIELEIRVQNLSSAPLNMNLDLAVATLNFAPDQNQARFQDVTVALKDRILHLNARKNIVLPEVKFLGWRDRYFCGIIEPKTDNYTALITKSNSQESEIGLSSKEFLVAPGQQLIQKFAIYLGPQELNLISSIRPDWVAVMHYGTFDFISRLLVQLLGILYRLVHNWGWAIVILSIIIYFLLYPLTLKQMRSMKEMQLLQPRIEELRKTYKDNPQKLNKEIMELYREHKVNPFGGCLPLILQIPIFFALYQALMRSVALKGANFLWIKDLSEPDRLFILPISLPILGNEVNILPILMTIGMFIQQKISMAATSSGSAEQQKLMMIIFPLMFGFIFYHMPSGLVLYWFINSSFMLLYQLRVNPTK
jgi:YidC/Oxa1 family membrane protein insertase